MLNIKELLKFDINSVELDDDEKNSSDLIVTVFFDNMLEQVDTPEELAECLRFRIVQVEDELSNKTLFKSINTENEKKYFNGKHQFNKCLSYKDGLVKFKFYDISFLELIKNKSFTRVEGGKKESTRLLQFRFEKNVFSDNLVYYMCIYVDNEIVSHKLNIKDSELQRISFTKFETYIKNGKKVNAKFKDYSNLKKVNVNLLFDKKSFNFTNNDILIKNVKDIEQDNIIKVFSKSRKNNGYNIYFLADLFSIYKTYSKFSFLLKSDNFNKLVLDSIKNIQNINMKVVKLYKNDEVELISDEKMYIQNDFQNNNRVLTYFSFYDESDNDRHEFDYQITITIKDILPDFLKSVLDRILSANNIVQELISKSTVQNYYNIQADLFTEYFFRDIYSKDEMVLFKLTDLLIYVSDFFVETYIDKLSILSLINEKTLSIKTLYYIKNVFDKIYGDIYVEYSLYKTYNYLEYNISKKVNITKNQVYYDILNDQNFEKILTLNINDLIQASQNGILKYFPGGSLNNTNTYCFHTINSINFNERKYKIDSPISKTNIKELNFFILSFLYVLNNKSEEPIFYNQIFDLLFDESLVFLKYGDNKESNKINVSLNNEKKQLYQQEIETEAKIDLLFNIFVNDFFVKYRNLFHVWLSNKAKIGLDAPYQVSALLNSYINSELVYDNFENISFLEKFIYVYLYKMIYKIEHFNFNTLRWELLSNEKVTQLQSRLLLCRFTNFISDEFNIPFIKELNFDLNNEVFILKGDKISQNTEIKDTYLDLILSNKNIINIKQNINIPQSLRDRDIVVQRDKLIKEAEIKRDEFIQNVTKEFNQNKALSDENRLEALREISSNKVIVDKLNSISDKVVPDRDLKDLLTRTFSASDSVKKLLK